jgi:hypothetical protein
MPSGTNQPSPPSRRREAQTAEQQPGPPPSAAHGADDSLLGVIERTTACALCDEQRSHSAPRNFPRASVEFDRARRQLAMRGGAQGLAKVQVERINLLDTAITHQERGIIRSQSYPDGERVGELRKILEA